MFAALCLLQVSPPVDARIAELCDTNLSVEMVFANTTAPPSCHRSISGDAFCVVPDGFPALPALGLGLSGLNPDEFFVWLAAHPESGFLAGSAWVLSPSDVSLLAAGGVACAAAETPETPPPDSNSVSVSAVFVVGCVAAVGGLACLVVAVYLYRDHRLRSNSLLDSVSTTTLYTV